MDCVEAVNSLLCRVMSDVYLIVAVVMNELVIDEPSQSWRRVAHRVTWQGHTLAIGIVDVAGEAGDTSRGC